MSDAANAGLFFGLALLAIVFCCFVILTLRDPALIRDFIARIIRVKITATGIEIERAVESAGFAVVAKENEKPDTEVLRETLKAISTPASILWVDDRPENNSYEIDALERIGLRVDAVRSNDEAMAAVRRSRGKYHLILSDIGRPAPERPDAGLELPRRLSSAMDKLPPVVYYTGKATSPRTADGYSVTDRPSRLFEIIQAELHTDESPESKT